MVVNINIGFYFADMARRSPVLIKFREMYEASASRPHLTFSVYQGSE